MKKYKHYSTGKKRYFTAWHKINMDIVRGANQDDFLEPVKVKNDRHLLFADKKYLFELTVHTIIVDNVDVNIRGLKQL